MLGGLIFLAVFALVFIAAPLIFTHYYPNP